MKIWQKFLYNRYFEIKLIENGFKINSKPFKAIK